MSTVKAKNHQIGADGTASNNFTIYQPSTPDGTSRWAVGVSGATTADVITVNSSGNVGIGTTSPSYKFQASNTNGDTQVGIYDLASGSSAARVDIRTSGTGASQWFIQTGNTASGLNGALRFYDQTVTSERMRIDSSGNVLIGQTANTYTGKVSFTHDSSVDDGLVIRDSRTTGGSTQISFIYNTTQVGRIHTTSSATTYATSSDYRLKENVVPMVGALDKVALLKPVTYSWKIDGSDGQGFIAHELQAVLPDAVVGEKDAVDADGNPQYQGVDTSFLVATLTAAIQELTKRVQELEAKVN